MRRSYRRTTTCTTCVTLSAIGCCRASACWRGSRRCRQQPRSIWRESTSATRTVGCASGGEVIARIKASRSSPGWRSRNWSDARRRSTVWLWSRVSCTPVRTSTKAVGLTTFITAFRIKANEMFVAYVLRYRKLWGWWMEREGWAGHGRESVELFLVETRAWKWELVLRIHAIEIRLFSRKIERM